MANIRRWIIQSEIFYGDLLDTSNNWLLVTGDWNICLLGLLTYQNGCFMGFNGWLVVTGT